MSRQLLVLAAAVAAHLTAVVVVGSGDDPQPTVRLVALPAPAPAPPEPCQAVTPPPPIVDDTAITAYAPITDADLDEGVVAIDATHHTLAADLLDRVLEHPMWISKGARIVPAVRDGKPDGFKLYAIRPGSIGERLGFANGDTLETINGFELTSADKALEVYTTLRYATHFEIAVRRHNAPLTLHLDITGISAQQLDAGIANRGHEHYVVEQHIVDRVMSDPMLYTKGARVVPSMRDGRPEGFKLYAIRPSSVYARIGLRNGDTLISVNGAELMDAKEPAFGAFSLHAPSDILIGLKRRGEPMTIRVTIE